MKKRWKALSLVVILVAAFIGGFALFGSNTADFDKNDFLYIPTGASYHDVSETLLEDGFVDNIRTFNFFAKLAGYPEHIKAGKYLIKKGMSNYEIIKKLRGGKQTPVKLVINKIRTRKDFITLLSKSLEPNAATFDSLLSDSAFMKQAGADANCALCIIIPDTYEFWWNTKASSALKKLANYYQEFWTPGKIQQAQSLGLTQQQVMILASIVEEETNYNEEKPLIASVYLNRLKKGMKLQADPTARYAAGDFTIKRITSAITNIPSPYNTYFTSGLPPAPICTPSKKTINAVLQTPPTDYLYFCAREDFSGTHRFSASYSEHLKNAALYQKALNQRGIH